MLHPAIATLQETLRPHLGLSKDRVETLALIVVAMVSARTVNLSHLAAERPGSALIASTYRRLQRFFQHVRLGRDWAAPITAELAGLRGRGSWYPRPRPDPVADRLARGQLPGARRRHPALPGAADVDGDPRKGQLQQQPADRADAALS